MLFNNDNINILGCVKNARDVRVVFGVKLALQFDKISGCEITGASTCYAKYMKSFPFLMTSIRSVPLIMANYIYGFGAACVNKKR